MASEALCRMLQAQVNPKDYKTGPPNLANKGWFTQEVLYSGNWTVQPDNTLQYEMVGQGGKGAVLWLPQRGLNSIWRVGFVGAGTLSTSPVQPWNSASAIQPNPSLIQAFGMTTSATVGPLIDYNTQISTVTPDAFSACWPTGFLWTMECAVPYDMSTLGISVAPDLSQNYSKVRGYAARICITCDTTKVGDLIMTGNISGDAIADSRDIAQSSSGAFRADDMALKSVTSKDYVLRADIDGNGIVMIQGPDLATQWMTPNSDIAKYHRGEVWRTNLPIPPPMGPVNSWPGAQVCTWWLSPIGVQIPGMAIALGTDPVGDLNPNQPVNCPVYNVAVPAIDYAGAVELTVRLQYRVNNAIYNPTTARGPIQAKARVKATHVYAKVGQNGQLVYSFDSNTSTFAILPRCTTVAAECDDDSTVTATFTPERPLGSIAFATGGIYVGTAISPFYGYEDPAHVHGDMATFATANISVTALTVDEEGFVGPMNIAKWDSLNAGQNVKVEGLCLAQCVPEGTAAQYVKDAIMKSDEALRVEALPLMNLLYNSEGPPLRRIWTKLEYDRFNTEVVPVLNPDIVSQWTQASGARAVGTAEAAGLFGTLGQALGGIGGALIGMPELGAQLGSQVGGAVDQGVGTAAGSFGYGSAGGKFTNANKAAGSFGYGSAGGSFGYGSAAGNFNGDRRRPRG